ncbi:MAG: FKBP-type peptidyl-prolyl cis-trans isomerase [Microbacterium sp.]
MRLRPFVALSVAAASAVLLAGCSGSGDATATATASADATAAVDLCDAQVAAGDATAALTVDGEAGEASTLTFEAPLDVSEIQAQVVTEGTGDAVTAGDYVSYAITGYDAEAGDLLGTYGYEDGEMLPQQISADSVLGQLFGCATAGTRVVAAFPATEATDTTTAASAEVYIVDLLSIVPTAAWGEEQDAVADMPTVTLADDGTPSITIDTTATPPTETEIATLKEGDGYEVQDGDYVLIQFRGARWSTGELFDGGDTWADGTPYTGATSDFVTGFSAALVGQTVGSQVLVVIPPADGYGEGEINEDDLVGETIVFVIDILGAQSATQ